MSLLLGLPSFWCNATYRAPARLSIASGAYGHEQPLVAPQFEHLWQAPERTMIEPHSWQVGASVSATQTSLPSFAARRAGAGAGADGPDDGRTATRGRSSWAAIELSSISFGRRNFTYSQLKM